MSRDENWGSQRSPRALAAILMDWAWDDETDDESRDVLEAASVAITQLADRALRLAQQIERRERHDDHGESPETGRDC